MPISKTHPIDHPSVERFIDEHLDKPTIGVVLNDPAGMHIRVATYLIKIAQKYEDTTLRIKPQDAHPIRITHKSILTLMTLGLTCGSQFEFIVNGPHAHDVQKEVFDLKIDGFPLFLKLTPDPNHNDDDGGSNNNDSSPPTTNHGSGAIMPPTSVPGASMSPFMSSGLLTRSFGPSLTAPSLKPTL